MDLATSVTSKKVPVHKNKRTASNNDKDCDNGNDSNASEAFEKRNKNTRHSQLQWNRSIQKEE